MEITREKEHFNKLAEKYSGQWWGNKTETGQFREKYRAELVADNVKNLNNFNLLEIGCSSGDFTFYLADIFARRGREAEIFAIDISDRLINIAKEKNKFNNIYFLEGNIYNIPFPEEYFDVVCGNAILHHLDLDRAFVEIKRVLKKEGKIIFFEPNLLNPQVFLEKKIKFIGKLLQNSPDETALVKNSIRKKLKNLSFKNINVANFDFYHPALPFFIVKNFNFIFKILEKTPLIKEISGSLYIYGEKK